MSVAFRRDSDEEHKEPVFERPLPAGPNLVTAHGLALTAAQVATLEAAVLAEADEPERARLQRELRYWRTRLATAQVAPPPPADEAAFGSRVVLRLEARDRTIDIVGDDEADPAAGRIAFTAPLARAVIGSMAGETLDFAGRPGAIEILSVNPIPALEDKYNGRYN